MDNSPMWDGSMFRLQLRPEEIPVYKRADTHAVSAEDRPASAEYDRFAYLVQSFAGRDYDEARIREGCPFLVQDVLFNALLCRADRDLAQMARILGEDPAPYEARAERCARAINDKLWSEERGTYLDFDLVSGVPIHVYVAAGFTPLYAGIPDEGRAKRMLDGLRSPGFGLGEKGGFFVPCYDRYGFGFSPVRYWRGPVWVNINWLLLRGLERYGFAAEADVVRRATVGLVREAGFFEYFHPETGTGHGSDFFSWTAALILDLLLENES